MRPRRRNPYHLTVQGSVPFCSVCHLNASSTRHRRIDANPVTQGSCRMHLLDMVANQNVVCDIKYDIRLQHQIGRLSALHGAFQTFDTTAGQFGNRPQRGLPPRVAQQKVHSNRIVSFLRQVAHLKSWNLYCGGLSRRNGCKIFCFQQTYSHSISANTSIAHTTPSHSTLFLSQENVPQDEGHGHIQHFTTLN